MNIFSRKTQIILDALAMILAFTLAYLLRFEFDLPQSAIRNLPVQTVLVVLLQSALLRYMQAHNIHWRSFSIYDLPAFLIPMGLACAPLMILRIYLPSSLNILRVPFSIIFINAVLGLSFLVGVRILRRVTVEYNGGTGNHGRRKKRKVLLAGAGAAGTLALRELRQNAASALNVIGFVDDDPSKANLSIHGKKVLGLTTDIPRLVDIYHVDEVIITIAKAPRESITRIVKICEKARLNARIIPSFTEIMEGRRQISALRNVDIEDVLGREPIELEDMDVEQFIRGKVVMITGAGGSIGSEIVRQVAHYRPAFMVLVERNELAMYTLDQELRNLPNTPPWRAVVADAGNMPRMRHLLKTYSVDMILHAAAYKHVPLMEDNPCEAIRNNTMTTYDLGKLAAEMHVKTFVLISTDKAVNPTSIMGCSKRVAELCIQHLADQNPNTRFMAVRFGNVLGSSGSVIPLFRQQIANGGPVTVTHPDMTRYFMMIPEAVSLVLKAATLGNSGEIMVLDMGNPMRIEELAERMIELSGLEAGQDIQIKYTGLRPGEKLFEELSTDEEKAKPTTHPKIFIGRIQNVAGLPVPAFIAACGSMERPCPTDQIYDLLRHMIPEANLQKQITNDNNELAAPSP